MSKKAAQKQPDRPRVKIGFWWITLLVLFVILFYFLYRPVSAGRVISWQRFQTEMLSRGAVEKLVVQNQEMATVYIKKEFANDSAFRAVMTPRWGQGIQPGPHYRFTIGSVESLERKLEEAQRGLPPARQVAVEYENRGDFTTWLPWLFFMLIILLSGRWLLALGGSGMGGSSVFNFGRTTARLLDKDNKSTVTFQDVAGLEEAKQEVKEIVDFLKEPQRYTRLGAKIPKGVIIVGPPGTGKTLLAKAVAGEAQVPFFTLSGSEFVEMFVGVGASRVRDLFRQAKERAPCIVFIDEIDAVGRSRGRNTLYSGANDERESTLNQLLTELDGFGTNSGVIVLAATNRADILDPALLRPGRFDRHIYLELPNQSERKAIFGVHLRPLTCTAGVDVDFLAAQTPGFSGADISNICNEAALIAARKKKGQVEKEDFIDAIDRIIAGLEKKSKIISPTEKKIIAFHEAGHAVVGWMLPDIDPLMKVSIIPRGKSLGAAWYLPEERQLRSLRQFTQRITAALAGRAAEEVVFGEVTSGAVDDLEKVTRDAYTVVAYFGFNKTIGNVSFLDSTGRSEFQKPYSEDTARLIDQEVRALVEGCYDRAKEILARHRAALDTLAGRLLSKEVIFRKELEDLLGHRPQVEAEIPLKPDTQA
jgi:AFG3 family protein